MKQINNVILIKICNNIKLLFLYFNFIINLNHIYIQTEYIINNINQYIYTQTENINN